MDKIDQHVSPYDLVMNRKVANDEYVVMLCKGTAYAACRVFPGRRVATSPNYHVDSGHGILSAPLSPEGLAELLNWTSRPAALQRFVELVRRVESSLNPEVGLSSA